MFKKAFVKKVNPVPIYAVSKWLAACCITGALFFTCSNPVEKRVLTPDLLPIQDTTVSVLDSLVLIARGSETGGKTVGFIWSLDSRALSAAPSADSACRLFFGIPDTGIHVVTVTGFGLGNTASDPETILVTVTLDPPVVHCITNDTMIWANDTVAVVAQSSDQNGSIKAYFWLIDSSIVPVISETGVLSWFFGAQSRTHRVRVAAMDDDSIMSALDSVLVQVIVNPPRITVLRDTIVAINDTLVIHAARLDTFSTDVRWLWAKNGTAFSDTTTTDSCAIRFGRNETGARRVLVKAIDIHRIESNVDTVRVDVVLLPPTVAIVHDTIVPINDPAVLHAHGADTNGSIARYVWALDGTDFSDTTAANSIATVYSRADTGRRIVVRVKALDDDSLESNTDSVRIVVHLKPSPSVAVTSDTSVFINDTFVVAARGKESTSKSPVALYVWAIDKKVFDDTTTTGRMSLRFGRADTGRHIVRVKAVDSDTMESLEDSLIVQVRLGAPRAVAMKDTAVFINDSLVLRASGTDSNGTVVRYAWAIDAGPFADTTTGGSLAKAWLKKDAGPHVVRIIAIDDDTIPSNPALCTVFVRTGLPVVVAMKDTAVFINDSLSLRASGTDTNGTVVRYAWAFDAGQFTDTTSNGSLAKAWMMQDAGRHEIRVKALDDDTVWSMPDSVVVRVRLGMPVIQPVSDTFATWGDTVAVVVRARDTNGTIQKYLWDTGATTAWTDSSSADTLRLTSGIHTRTRVVVGARDDDGFVAQDTFFIDYKAVRCTVSAQGPTAAIDTVLVHSHDTKQISTPLSFSARRIDGVTDTFAYSLLSGTSPSALVESYRGKDTACTLKTLDTGTFYWKVVAVDPHFDTAATSVSALCIMLQRRICFIGHSIIAGYGGESGKGGVRRMVTDTLRSKAGLRKKIGCEGPLTPQLLLPAQDDSCLAVVGKTSAAIYDSMQVYGSTNADLWIYMCGVNEGYEFPTPNRLWRWANYTVATIDSMHGRNPKGEIYVFNGIPFPADTTPDFTHWKDSIFTKNLPVFNRMLDSVVKARRLAWQAGGQAGIWLVDVFTPMSLPDSHFNPVYYCDFLHPNQLGYDLMTRELFKVMRAANSPFIK
jgi:hypothetical protein